MNVVLRDEARSDIVDGASFFDRQRDGLGNYSVACVFDDFRAMIFERWNRTRCFAKPSLDCIANS